jgi:acetyl esterase/lipase
MRSTSSQPFLEPRYDVRVTRDVVYGQAGIGYSSGVPGIRPLRLDVYEPTGADADGRAAQRPALLLAFGGAFHRGSKEDDTVDDNGHRNTSVAQYCRAFARRGYVAFSVEYRLVPEDPVPGDTPVVGSPDEIPRSRVDHVRRLLGLPLATTEMLWRGVEAASDDLATAFDFVCANAARWSIAPQRIALGGFSAGARTALNVAYAERRPVAAVVSLSGYMARSDLVRHVTGKCRRPPAMLVTGEHDLDYVRNNFPVIERHLVSMGIPCEAYRIANATHFYSAASSIVRTDGSVTTLEEAMAEFLYLSLRTNERR